MPDIPPPPASVAAAFQAMPDATRDMAHQLRALLFEVADALGVNRLEETLKWGEPAYLPGRSGTTVRIGWDTSTGACKLLVHCQTTLIEGWRERFGEALEFEGNRAVHIDPRSPLNEAIIRICAAEAFAYHKRGN